MEAPRRVGPPSRLPVAELRQPPEGPSKSSALRDSTLEPLLPDRDVEARLAERRRNFGNELSGGEQQMLAMGRALMLNPKLLLLDEPLEGLAPIIVEELLRSIARLVREEGMSAIIVEQNPRLILPITARAVVLDRGSVVHEGDSAALLADRAMLETHLGVTDSHPRRAGRVKH